VVCLAGRRRRGADTGLAHERRLSGLATFRRLEEAHPSDQRSQLRLLIGGTHEAMRKRTSWTNGGLRRGAPGSSCEASAAGRSFAGRVDRDVRLGSIRQEIAISSAQGAIRAPIVKPSQKIMNYVDSRLAEPACVPAPKAMRRRPLRLICCSQTMPLSAQCLQSANRNALAESV
jgi:hypothetical protein